MSTQTVIGFDVVLSSTMTSGTRIPFDAISTNIEGGWNNTAHKFKHQ